MRVEAADLLVVGTGPAGLAAAAEAARSGARVVAVDESPAPGGCLRFQIERADRGAGAGKPQLRPGAGEAARLTREAAEAGARVLSGISVWGLFPEWEAYLSPVGPRGPDDSPDAVRARAVVAATGAVQNPVGIPGWTLPGVLSPGGVQSLISLHRVRPGRRAVVIGTDLLGVITAGHLSLAGIEVTAVLPPAAGPYTRDSHDPYAAGSEIDRVAALWGVPLRRGHGAAAIIGDDRVRAVAVVPLDANVHAPGGHEERWEVDLAVISGGLSPLVNLVHAAGCPVAHIPDLGGHVPLHGPDLETPLPRVFVAGSVAGAASAQAAEAQGRVAGLTAARRLGFLDGGAADSRLVQAESRLAEALAEMPAFVPDAERGLRLMAQLWAARPAASGVDPGITAAQE